MPPMASRTECSHTTRPWWAATSWRVTRPRRTSSAAATSIEDVRAAFAELSEVLVPKFLDAELPGVVGFVCTMKKAQWAQRGETAANPYYGKAMATCGVPINRGG